MRPNKVLAAAAIAAPHFGRSPTKTYQVTIPRMRNYADELEDLPVSSSIRLKEKRKSRAWRIFYAGGALIALNSILATVIKSHASLVVFGMLGLVMLVALHGALMTGPRPPRKGKSRTEPDTDFYRTRIAGATIVILVSAIAPWLFY